MERYVRVHENPQGPGDARPTALQIIRDEGLAGQMTDKVFLITGSSNGIGLETARALSATGARLFLLVRDLDKAKRSCASILDTGRAELVECDVSSLSSVRAAAEFVRARTPTLNVMICNAGVMALPRREVSVDGFEMQLATNYLGHFLLFWLLRDLMSRGSSLSSGFDSRLVNVSSSGHHGATITRLAKKEEEEEEDMKDGGGESYYYTPEGAYGQSKLAQIYMSNSVDRRFGGQGRGDEAKEKKDGAIHGWSVMPGGVVTKLQKHLSKDVMESWESNDWLMNKWMKNAEQGAANTVLAAVGKGLEGRGGGYLEDCGIADTKSMIPGLKGIDKIAFDEDEQDRLWGGTMKLLGLG